MILEASCCVEEVPIKKHLQYPAEFLEDRSEAMSRMIA